MIAAIVLAAGSSTRMGAFKQLLPLGGRPAVQLVTSSIRSKVDQLYVVVGHRAGEVEAALSGASVECVFNPHYEAGMLASIQCGIRAAGQADAYLICLADQPGIEPATVDAVLVAAAGTAAGIVIPTYQGRRGHPILLRRGYRQKILALAEDQGLHRVTRGYPEDTLEVAVGDPQILSDMDTPADYWKVRQTLENRGR